MSLRVESEGGSAEEIVSEENGVLISIMLRQYFMSLKVMGKWKKWCTNLRNHWSKVQDGLNPHCTLLEPQKPPTGAEVAFRTALKRSGSTGGSTPRDETSMKKIKSGQDVDAQKPEDDDTDEDSSDSEGELSDVRPDDSPVIRTERELVLVRKVMRKWWRLAGLPGQPKVCDGMAEGEFMANWTKVS